MSTPSSSVGVAESKFSYQCLGRVALNRPSSASRSFRSSRPVCSAAITRRRSPLEKRSTNQPPTGRHFVIAFVNRVQAWHPSRAAAASAGTVNVRFPCRELSWTTTEDK